MTRRDQLIFVDVIGYGHAVFKREYPNSPLTRRVSAIYRYSWDAGEVSDWLREREMGYPKRHGEVRGGLVS
jgi:hypothetical protein